MKRAQIQLDDRTFETLRREAFRGKKSIASIIRAVLDRYVSTGRQKKQISPESFSFIGAGTSTGRGAGHIAENHDVADWGIGDRHAL